MNSSIEFPITPPDCRHPPRLIPGSDDEFWVRMGHESEILAKDLQALYRTDGSGWHLFIPQPHFWGANQLFNRIKLEYIRNVNSSRRVRRLGY
jgi:hypothetical protein